MSIKPEMKCTDKASATMLVPDLAKFTIRSNLVISVAIRKLLPIWSTAWLKEETTILSAMTSTVTWMRRTKLTKPTKTKTSGTRWPSKVLPNPASSLLTGPLLSTQVRSGTSRLYLHHYPQRIQRQESAALQTCLQPQSEELNTKSNSTDEAI